MITSKYQPANPEKKEMISALHKKNKVLIQFYHSYITLEDSTVKMSGVIDLLGQDLDFPFETAIEMIYSEADNMNAVFSEISKSIVNAY